MGYYHTSYALLDKNKKALKIRTGVVCFGDIVYDRLDGVAYLNYLQLHGHVLLREEIQTEYRNWLYLLCHKHIRNRSAATTKKYVLFPATIHYAKFLWIASLYRLQVEQPWAIVNWYTIYNRLLERGIGAKIAGAKALAMCESVISDESNAVIDLLLSTKPTGFADISGGYWQSDSTSRALGGHSPTPSKSIVSSGSLLAIMDLKDSNPADSLSAVIAGIGVRTFINSCLSANKAMEAKCHRASKRKAGHGEHFIPITYKLINLIEECG